MILELERHPDIRRRLTDEIVRVAPDGPLSLERIEQMPYLEQVASEVRRLSPVVHVFFGKAREAIEFAGHTIPAGWNIFWGIRSSHLKPEIYPDPERFDPERFSSARAESQRHPHAFAPNGAGRPDGAQVRGLRAGAADAEGVRGRAAARPRLAAIVAAGSGSRVEPGSTNAEGRAARSGDAGHRRACSCSPVSVTPCTHEPRRARGDGGVAFAPPPCASSTSGFNAETMDLNPGDGDHGGRRCCCARARPARADFAAGFLQGHGGLSSTDTANRASTSLSAGAGLTPGLGFQVGARLLFLEGYYDRTAFSSAASVSRGILGVRARLGAGDLRLVLRGRRRPDRRARRRDHRGLARRSAIGKASWRAPASRWRSGSRTANSSAASALDGRSSACRNRSAAISERVQGGDVFLSLHLRFELGL